MKTMTRHGSGFCLALAGFAAAPLAYSAGDELAAHPAVRIEAAGGWGGIHFEDRFGADEYFGNGVFEGAVSGTQRFGDIALQVDLHGTHENLGLENLGLGDQSTIGGLGHIGWRDESLGMVGVVGGYETLDRSQFVSENFFRVGAEGEIYLNDLTLGLNAGYSHAESIFRSRFFRSRFNRDFGYAGAHARYYFGDNAKLEIGGGAQPTSASDVYFAHVAAEYKFDELPIALFARWNGVFYDNSRLSGFAIGTRDTEQGLAGFKLYFGGQGDTLRHYDRAYFSDSCLFQGAGAGFC